MNSDAEVIARRVRQVLLHPQVPFGRLNRRMSQRDLDLFEGARSLCASLAKVRRTSWGASAAPSPLPYASTTS